MIRQAYGLTDYPFGEHLPVDELFRTTQFDPLQDRLNLLLGIRSIGLVYGNAGVGKSSMVRAWAQSLNQNSYSVIYIHNTSGTIRGFLRILSDALGRPGRQSRDRLLSEINAAFVALEHQQAKQPVIILDEAQSIYPCVLEEVRLMTSLDLNSPRPPVFVLVASREFIAELKRSTHESLRQRIRQIFKVCALDRDEIKPYISHQLKRVHCPRPLFTDEAQCMLFQETQGIPRAIGTLALEAMRLGAQLGHELIDTALVVRAIEERQGL